MPEVVQQELEITPPQAVPAEAPTEPEQSSEQATEAPAEGKKPTEEQPEKQGKSRFERRLDKAYRRAAEAEAKALAYERQLKELSQPKEVGRPKLEEFNDIEKYATAVAEYEKGKALKEHTQQQSVAQARQQQQRIIGDWEDKLSQATQEDFEEVVGELTPDSPLNIAIMQANPNVAYHLGTHLDEARRLATLDPISQIREVGKLEAILTAEPPKPKPSKAPAPIKPLSGASDTSGEPSTEKVEDWIKWRSKKVHKR